MTLAIWPPHNEHPLRLAQFELTAHPSIGPDSCHEHAGRGTDQRRSGFTLQGELNRSPQ
jgi:hypothetical protein